MPYARPPPARMAIRNTVKIRTRVIAIPFSHGQADREQQQSDRDRRTVREIDCAHRAIRYRPSLSRIRPNSRAVKRNVRRQSAAPPRDERPPAGLRRWRSSEKRERSCSAPTTAPAAANNFTSPAPVAPSTWPGSISRKPRKNPSSDDASEMPLMPVAASTTPTAAVPSEIAVGNLAARRVDHRARCRARRTAPPARRRQKKSTAAMAPQNDVGDLVASNLTSTSSERSRSATPATRTPAGPDRLHAWSAVAAKSCVLRKLTL